MSEILHCDWLPKPSRKPYLACSEKIIYMSITYMYKLTQSCPFIEGLNAVLKAINVESVNNLLAGRR